MKKLLIVTILIIVLSLTLVACKDKPVEPVESVTIATAEDFVNIATMTGDAYDNTDFSLSSDIVIDDYVPICGAKTPFIGNFDGNNKTITLTVSAIPEDGYVGLFGCVSGSRISNVNVNITVPETLRLNLTTTAIGGIAGLTIGDVTMDNVNVTLKATPTVSETVETNVNYPDSTKWSCYNVEYVGGLVGSAGGSLVVDNCKVSTLDVTANSYVSSKYTRYNEVYAQSVFIGGVVGSVVNGSTLDISNTTAPSFTANVIAETAFVGGLVGDGASTTIEASRVSATARVTARTKGYIGGIAGYLKNSTISNTDADVTLLAGGRSAHFNFGGLVGYLDGDIVAEGNTSGITDCTAYVRAADVYRVINPSMCTVSYGVGYLKNAAEKGCAFSGEIALPTVDPVPASWGTAYGIAYGCATASGNASTATTDLGKGQSISHVTYNDDGDKTSTISPRV